jgi:type I restriction enzyme R subunit
MHAGLDSVAVAKEVEGLLDKFPNWVEYPDERRRLRLNLYKPVLNLPDDQRKAAVEQIMQVLEQAAGG